MRWNERLASCPAILRNIAHSEIQSCACSRHRRPLVSGSRHAHIPAMHWLFPQWGSSTDTPTDSTWMTHKHALLLHRSDVSLSLSSQSAELSSHPGTSKMDAFTNQLSESVWIPPSISTMYFDEMDTALIYQLVTIFLSVFYKVFPRGYVLKLFLF